MKDSKRVVSPIKQVAPTSVEGLRIGKIVRVDAGGNVFVAFGDGDDEGVPAHLTASAASWLRESPTGKEVLLGFDGADPYRPIIIDTIFSTLQEAADDMVDAVREDSIHTIKKRVALEAEEEMVLRCGEAHITLTRAGKVSIRGNYLISRATGTNCIKGSSVRIN